MTTAVILSTGDELTSGRVVDTNSAVIAERLYSAGIKVAAVLKVGDERERLIWAFEQAGGLGDLIIGTGGLGPTADDLTTEMVAAFLGCRLVQDETVANGLIKRFEARGIAWTENNLKQALFPEGATIIPNPLGTAPGFRVSIGPGQDLIWLSGVPQEMIAMLDSTVMGWIGSQQEKGTQIHSSTFKIYGLTESKLDSLVKPILLSAHEKFSFRAHFPDLTLRLTVTGGEEEKKTFDRHCEEVRRVLGEHLYAEGDVTMEECVGRLLSAKKHSLALAESCTGGLISRRITRIAGSSSYYLGGAVTYANEAKINFLGVTAATLEKHGAVSKET
ncbi:MAG TPA: nicotinamide-nucleotide amidohydrolase family protein, partial [Candidatus Binatia bacterium]|nr:nicotinamide-nucleotide amidohydrolase family protein [Candidatus Binatia bacterium]